MCRFSKGRCKNGHMSDKGWMWQEPNQEDGTSRYFERNFAVGGSPMMFTNMAEDW